MVAAISGDTGLGLRHVTSVEVEELDEGAGQEEKDAAAAQGAEYWGCTLNFLVAEGSVGGGGGCDILAQHSSLYLQEKWHKLRAGALESHVCCLEMQFPRPIQ